MKNRITLAMLIVAGALSLPAAAQQGGQQAPRVIEAQKLKDNLYVFRGNGTNSMVFVTTRGVLVADAKGLGWGKPILDKIKELIDKPVTTLINTDTHGDHVNGNIDFPDGVDIIVQENTKINMEKMIPNSTADQTMPPQTIFQANNGRGLPRRTFKDTMTLFSGADTVEMYYFGRGHSNGEAWLIFPAHRVAYAGDIISGKNLPLLDSNNGGSAVAIADTLQRGYEVLKKKNVETVVSGHGGLMTMVELEELIAFNREFLDDMRAAKKAGRSVDEVAASWKVPAKYAGYAPAEPVRLKNNIKLAYAELDAGVTK